MENMSDTDSDISCPDIIDVWVWIHVPKIKDLEERYWDALQRLQNGQYTIYYDDPQTLDDNRKRNLVMRMKITYHVNLENQTDEVEEQLREDIDGMLEVLERNRGAQGASPSTDDDEDDDEDDDGQYGDTEDGDEDGEMEEESDDEPVSKAQLRPKFSSPVPDYDSEATTVLGSAADSDADDDLDLAPRRRLSRKKRKANKALGLTSDYHSEVDTDEILALEARYSVKR